jgi:hypothetical protein
MKTPSKISGLDIHKASRGPVARSSGCGAFKNRKSDKKLRRREDRRSCQG